MYIIVSRGSYFLQFLKSRRFLRVRFGMMMIWSQMRFFREFRHSINSGLVSFNITSFFNVLKSCVEVINFLLFHSLSPFTLQTIFIATSSFALQSHEILGLILELFLWKLMAVSRPWKMTKVHRKITKQKFETYHSFRLDNQFHTKY